MTDRWADGPNGTTCNGCGNCCVVVQLPLTRADVLADATIPARVRTWYLNDLRPIPWKEAKRRAPWLKAPHTVQAVDRGRMVVGYPSYYECRHYDTDTRRCRAWEDRPEPCAGFPYYGRDSLAGMTLPPECEFRHDIGEVPVAFTRKETAT